MTNSPTTLDTVLAQCWSLLREGVTQPNSTMRTPVLGSVSDAGCELRTVILRGFDPVHRTLQCHTDTRSPKMAELRKFNRVQWLFYASDARVQLRAAGLAKVLCEGALADAAWAEQHPRSRRVYQTEQAPGTASELPTGGFSQRTANQSPNVDNTNSGRPNFAVIECRIDKLDWLQLGMGENTRAQFNWTSESLQATWCVP